MLQAAFILSILLTVVIGQYHHVPPTFRNTFVTVDFGGKIGAKITGCITPETLKNHNLNYHNVTTFQIRFRGETVPILNRGAVAHFPERVDIFINQNYINIVKRGAFLDLPLVFEISLQGNQISVIEVGVFADLPSLRYIHIDYNEIRMLEPNVFSNLPRLEMVDMNNNQLMYFEQEWFNNTPNLLAINIHDNLILTIGRASFADLSNLEYLQLYSNRIEYIHKNAFYGLKKLTWINLNNNRLKTFDVDLKLIPLTHLFLFSNNLTYIPREVLADIHYTIEQFELYGNPLQCPCYDEIIKWSTDYKIRDPFTRCRQINTVCVYLENHEDKCLEDINQSDARELDSIFYASYNVSC